MIIRTHEHVDHDACMMHVVPISLSPHRQWLSTNRDKLIRIRIRIRI